MTTTPARNILLYAPHHHFLAHHGFSRGGHLETCTSAAPRTDVGRRLAKSGIAYRHVCCTRVSKGLRADDLPASSTKYAQHRTVPVCPSTLTSGGSVLPRSRRPATAKLAAELNHADIYYSLDATIHSPCQTSVTLAVHGKTATHSHTDVLPPIFEIVWPG